MCCALTDFLDASIRDLFYGYIDAHVPERNNDWYNEYTEVSIPDCCNGLDVLITDCYNGYINASIPDWYNDYRTPPNISVIMAKKTPPELTGIMDISTPPNLIGIMATQTPTYLTVMNN